MTAAILEPLGKMEPDPTDIGVEANCVMQYLSNFPGEFISEREIARRADGKERFLKDPHWAHNAFSELIELGLLETDGGGRYRQKTKDAKAVKHGAKFLDPKLRAILEKSNHGFDLSNYD